MNIKQLPVIYLSFLAPLLAQTAHSAPTNETVDNGIVVISGSKTEKYLADSPVRVEVVSKEEIALKNAKDLSEALQDVPGISLRPVHGKAGTEVWLQGVDAKRVLVLVDGEPVSKSTSGVTDVTQIGVANIEQVEIVKGATSALYGSGAIGGIINVITRQSEQALNYFIKGDAGTYFDQNRSESDGFATLSSAGLLSIQNGLWDTELSYDLRTSDGFTVDPGTWNHEGAEGSRLNTSAEVGFSPSDTQRYFVAAARYDEDLTTKYIGSGPTYRRTEKSEEVVRNTYRAGADWSFAEFDNLNLRYFYEDFSNPTNQDIVSAPGIEKARQANHKSQQISTQYDYQVSENIVRTLGAEYFIEEIDQQQRTATTDWQPELTDNAERTNAVVYYQDDIFIGDNFEVLPGFRFQNDSDFGNYFTPKINGRYNFPALGTIDHFFRFGIGRGYRAPNLKERHFVFDHSHLGYMVLGSPDLKPEYSNSYQIGWVFLDDFFNADINFFQNDLKDMIETKFSHLNGTTRIYEYTNLLKARTRGAELAGRLTLTDSISSTGGYTYLDAEDRATGNRLAQRSKHQVKLGATYRSPDSPFSLNLSARWQSEAYFDLENTKPSKAFTVFDASAQYEFLEGISIYTGVDNLFDIQKDFKDSSDLRPEEGRYAYLGVRIENF